MKTAISLPDTLFKAGDSLAKKLGISRSELYARALEEYIARRRADRVTERLNAVYSPEESRMAPALAKAQARAMGSEEW
jgi:metal-responsive CopG/Arc/MetJ family transcriptional regulator